MHTVTTYSDTYSIGSEVRGSLSSCRPNNSRPIPVCLHKRIGISLTASTTALLRYIILPNSSVYSHARVTVAGCGI